MSSHLVTSASRHLTLRTTLRRALTTTQPTHTTHLQQPRANIPSQASPLVARPHVSSLPPSKLASPHHLPVVSRSLTDTSQVSLTDSSLSATRTTTDMHSQVPSLSVRSVATRSRPSFSSASCHSSVLSVRLLKTSSPISASRALPSALSRSLSRHTSSPSSRTPTFAPSTPSVSPSRARTSSLPAVSAASALRCSLTIYDTTS